MKKFQEYLKERIKTRFAEEDIEFLKEGGNTTVQDRQGNEITAKSIPLKDIGRKNFVKKFNELLIQINKLFKKDHGHPLWISDKLITDAIIYNGSTSFIMNQKYDDISIVSAKSHAGDLDVVIKREDGPLLYDTLEKYEHKEIVPDAEYMGTNARSKNKIGNTLICVFLLRFETSKGSIQVPAQVDFELTEFENELPTEWAKFSHSSSFEDAQAGFKGVAHKFLIRALVGAKSQRDDIVIATPASTPEKIRLEKRQPNLVRLLGFGVDSGVGSSFTQMFDEDGNPIKIDGKFVYRRLKREEKSYNKSLDNLFKIAFGKYNKKDAELLWSFTGILKLGKKYLSKKEMQDTANRFFEIFFGVGGQSQAIDPTDPQKDVATKLAAYNEIIKAWKVKEYKNKEKVIEDYVRRVFKK